jgi:hypothetical protein
VNKVPQPTTMEELQSLLARQDMTATKAIAIELPRVAEDADPRCAMLFVGPEAYAALNLVIQVIEATSQQMNQKQVVESSRLQ